ncbi:GspH/FimT family pseudopilin [Massilia sp. R2A-15]|uniref:GspH/FimT family pseudopilin n=1 Tax=Massilia sp. R2A-15 TaxID=3064278 RepID=UPI002734E40C|nr:GspH/FimT family pseudopilin [Massilia sp. R2A-15]WLI90377.1 GspH/FimT family pseudopilin [Massilia sp. R2A-15]
MLAMKPGRRRGGATLLELMAVLAISAVMMGMAMPGLHHLVRSQQLKAGTSDLFGAIGLARMQAIARGRKVLLAPADANVGWRGGWVVFIDQDGNRRPDAGEEVIARHGPLAAGIEIGASFTGQQGAPYLAYNSMGRSCSDTSSQAARFGTLSLAHGGQIRRIKINMLGRARICDPARDGASCAGDDP